MTAPTADDQSGTTEAPARRRFGIARVAAVLAVLAIVLLWLYVLTRPEQSPPGALSDPAFAVAAEPICSQAMGAVAALPPAYDATTASARADVIDQSDTILSGMLEQLRSIAPPTDTHDGSMVDEWLGDWETFVSDRADYANRLRQDPQAQFLVTEKAGQQITEPIDFFANTANPQMSSCATPHDL